MIKNFICKKPIKFNFTSKYNVKLYKKCLSFKLLNLSKITMPNLIISENRYIPITTVTTIYARNELIPVRLLRFFALLNNKDLVLLGVKYLFSRRLGVYNGKKSKFFNINSSILEITLRCSLRFGDLIFTRAPYFFKKKKTKK